MLTESVEAGTPYRQLAEHYGRAIIHGLISGTLDPDRAQGLGRMAGSYARLALLEAAHLETVERVSHVLRFGKDRV